MIEKERQDAQNEINSGVPEEIAIQERRPTLIGDKVFAGRRSPPYNVAPIKDKPPAPEAKAEAGKMATPTPKAIANLIADPGILEAFEKKFGKGSAKKYLEEKDADPKEVKPEEEKPDAKWNKEFEERYKMEVPAPEDE